MARKEFLREIITGPSAFLIPLGMLHVIKKNFGRGNNVKLNYIDGFQKPFTDFATKYSDEIASGNADKGKFYKRIFKDTIERSVMVAFLMQKKCQQKKLQNTLKVSLKTN